MNMKVISKCISVVLVCMFVASAGAEPLRQWTSSMGATVKAEFVDVEGQNVILRNEAGNRLSITFSDLSTQDQAFVKKWQKKNAPVVTVNRKSDRKLASFVGGDNRGLHAVYTHSKFDAEVNNVGILVIYPKDENGERISMPPFKVSLDCLYSEKGERRRKLKVVKFDNSPDPALQPASVHIKGMLEEYVPFESIIEFNDNEISVWHRTEPSKTMGDAFLCYSSCLIGLMKHVKELDTVDASKAAVEGYEFTVSYAKNKAGNRQAKTGNESFTFWEPTSLRGSISRGEVSGGVFGPRTIKFSCPKDEDAAWLALQNYPNMPLYEAFRVNLRKADHASSRHANEKMTIRIE